MKTGIHVGLEKETVIQVQKVIEMILNSSNAEAVKIQALNTLMVLTKIDNVAISDCSIIDKKS